MTPRRITEALLRGGRDALLRCGVYVLLLGGATIFAWPFLWMAATSVKLDREMFGDHIRFWPESPVPQPRTPYVDESRFRDLDGPRMKELLPVLESHLAQMSIWPAGEDHDAATSQTARGVYRRMQQLLPPRFWQSPSDELKAEVLKRVDEKLAADVFQKIRRCIAFGALTIRSYDFVEDQLVPSGQGASLLDIGGSARATLVPGREGRQDITELHGDFAAGDTVTLARTFTTSFPIARLHRIQLSLRPDDTWASVNALVEKGGRKFRAERPAFLSDSKWAAVTWQEPGPDDTTNKIHAWIPLRDIGPGSVTAPNEIRITLELQRNTALGAWWAKIIRNYQLTFDHVPFWRYVATSVFLVILNLAGTLFSCSIVAYSFARLHWPGRGLCFMLMLATMMIPAQVTMIPTFLIIRALGWYNTLYPLWVGSLFAGAFNVFLLTQFLRGIPRDLEDAAKIDGCGFWRVYWHVMLPLVKPTLAAIAIFTFMGTWNEFMTPLIYLSDQRLYPLSLGLYALNVQAGSSMGMMMAGSLLMTLPVIAIFFFAQKYFIQGVTLSGTKG